MSLFTDYQLLTDSLDLFYPKSRKVTNRKSCKICFKEGNNLSPIVSKTTDLNNVFTLYVNTLGLLKFTFKVTVAYGGTHPPATP